LLQRTYVMHFIYRIRVSKASSKTFHWHILLCAMPKCL
jgi:hypothetical protein